MTNNNADTSLIGAVIYTTHLPCCVQLTASEEDVWRGVLAWGQAKAGVQGSVQQWTDTDRAKMKQVLNVSMYVYASIVCVHHFSRFFNAQCRFFSLVYKRVWIFVG